MLEHDHTTTKEKLSQLACHIKQNDSSTVKELVETSTTILDEYDPTYTYTPVLLACMLNNVEILRILLQGTLLQKGGNPNMIYQPNGQQITAMQFAAKYENISMMKLLIEYRFDCDRLINNILHAGAHYSVFLQLCQNGNVECMDYLMSECKLQDKIDIQQRDIYGYNDLHVAVIKENVKMVEYLLSNVYNNQQIKSKIMNQPVAINGMHLSQLAVQKSTLNALHIFKLLTQKYQCPVNTHSTNGKRVIINDAASFSPLIFEYMLDQRLYPHFLYLTHDVIKSIFMNGQRSTIIENVTIVIKYWVKIQRSVGNHVYIEGIANIFYNIILNGKFEPFFEFLKYLFRIICVDCKHFVKSQFFETQFFNQIADGIKDLGVDDQWYDSLHELQQLFSTPSYWDTFDNNANESNENENDGIRYCDKKHLMSKMDSKMEERCVVCDNLCDILGYQCAICDDCICTDCGLKLNQLIRMLKRKQFKPFKKKIKQHDENSKMLKLV